MKKAYLTAQNIQSTSKMVKITLILSFLVILALARDDPKYDHIFGNKEVKFRTLNQQKLYWFDQVTDHYDYRSATYWKQRYWVSNQFFKPKTGPVFLYICGQWVCSGVPDSREWTGILAKNLNGIVIGLQHRFYGASLPFGKDSFSLENMKLLNSEQALRDIANFIQHIKDHNLYGITDQPWIIAGGSYAGALAAWFRYKYPHLVIAAVASSAVIQAIEDFQDFDQQIYLSSQKSGDYCSDTLNACSHRVQTILNQGQASAFSFKSRFNGGQHLTNQEFLFFWADSIVMPIQYGARKLFCEGLKLKSADEQFQYLIQNAKKLQVYEYSSFYLRNETFTYQTQSSSRPWYFQYCTQYGWFQTFSSRHSIRSKQLTLDFYSQFCAATYGEGTWPKVDRKNTQYGGLNEASSRILFTNGGQDPWKWASLQVSRDKDLIARVVDCDNSAHCVDMYSPTDQDCEDLKKVRYQQYQYLQEWTDEYWRDLQKKKMEKVLFRKFKEA